VDTQSASFLAFWSVVGDEYNEAIKEDD